MSRLLKVSINIFIFFLLYSVLSITNSKLTQAANIVVNSNLDNTTTDGKCTLREALINANSNAQSKVDCVAGTGLDKINFNGDYNIGIAAALPTITDVVEIDGLNGGVCSSQPNLSDYKTLPKVTLIGINNNNFNGLSISGLSASNSKISGLKIQKMGINGILVNNSNNINISCNWLGGPNIYGSSNGNKKNGIELIDSTMSLINANTISMNTENGIYANSVINNLTEGLRITNNLVGLNYGYNSNVGGNGQIGIKVNKQKVLNLSGNYVAKNGTDSNTHSGISLSGSEDFKINDNYIGTEYNQNIARGNSGDGIKVESSTNTAKSKIYNNIICNNLGNGITFNNNSPDSISIFNNSVGIFSNNNCGNSKAGIVINNSDQIEFSNDNNTLNYISYNAYGSVNIVNSFVDVKNIKTRNLLTGAITFDPITQDNKFELEPNDFDDSDTGPNNKLNYVQLEDSNIFYQYANRNLEIKFTIFGGAGKYYVDFYKADDLSYGNDDVDDYLGSSGYVTHPGGRAQYTVIIPNIQPNSISRINNITHYEYQLGKFISSTVSPAITSSYDFDGDNISDIYDADDDNDGIPDILEGNCNIDSDNDGSNDCRDIDSDNDGILDSIELNGDYDFDGIPNYLDLDSDGDGKSDNLEAYDTDNNGISNVVWVAADWDFDGMSNAFDTTSRVNPSYTAINPTSSKYVKLDLNNNNLDDFLDSN